MRSEKARRDRFIDSINGPLVLANRSRAQNVQSIFRKRTGLVKADHIQFPTDIDPTAEIELEPLLGVRGS